MALPWVLRLLALLLLGGMFLPGSSCWGFNHLAYLSGTGRLLAAGLALVSLVPAGFSRLYGFLVTGFHRRVFASRRGTVVFALAVGVWCGVLPTRTHFLGDGYLLLDVLGDGHSHRPFDAFSFLLKGALLQAGAPWGLTALTVYRAVALAAGAGGVLLLVPLLKRTGWEPWRQVLFFFLFLGSGPAVMFHGYVEDYALLWVFFTAFGVALAACADGKAGLLCPAGMLAAAILSHLVAVVGLPAFAVLWWRRRRGVPARTRWAAAALVLASLATVLGWVGMTGATASGPDPAAPANLLKPLLGPRGILSLHNVVTLGNLLLILSPVALAVMLTVRDRRPGATLRLTLGVLGASWLLFVLLVDPKLGSARDWDLLTATGAALLVWAATVFPVSRRGVVQAVLVTAAFSCAWVGVTVPEGSAVARFTGLTGNMDGYRRGFAWDTLGNYHRDHGRFDLAVDAYAQAVAARPGHARFQGQLGAACISLYNRNKAEGRADESLLDRAESCLRRSMALDPSYPFVIKNLALLMVRKKHFDEGLRLLLRLRTMRPLDYPSQRALGYCYLKTGRYPESQAALRKAAGMNPAADSRPAAHQDERKAATRSSTR